MILKMDLLGSSGYMVNTVATIGSKIFAGGSFTTSTALRNLNNISYYANDMWNPMGQGSAGLNGQVNTIIPTGANHCFVGGAFTADSNTDTSMCKSC